MAKSPAFQFYPQDFLSDMNVQAMEPEELGAYIRLLCHDWIEDGLPDDDKILSRLSGARERWGAMKGAVLSCFEKIDGKIFNPRLKIERKKQEKFSKRQRAAGVASGRSRRKQTCDNDLQAEPVFNLVATKTNSSSSSSSSSSDITKREREITRAEAETEKTPEIPAEPSEPRLGYPSTPESTKPRQRARNGGISGFPGADRELIEPDAELANLFERTCGMGGQLMVWLNECQYPPDWIRSALITTVEAEARRPIPYCKKILESYQAEGGPPSNELKNGRGRRFARGEPQAAESPQREYKTGDKLD